MLRKFKSVFTHSMILNQTRSLNYTNQFLGTFSWSQIYTFSCYPNNVRRHYQSEVLGTWFSGQFEGLLHSVLSYQLFPWKVKSNKLKLSSATCGVSVLWPLLQGIKKNAHLFLVAKIFRKFLLVVSNKYSIHIFQKILGLYLENRCLGGMIILTWIERNGLGICGLVDPAQRTDKCCVFLNMEIKFGIA